ncbi:MAG: F0F1 ATP synthase subunit delta [Clostridia bacterium]|nr:F0F1 ATP synthase subunit delta [Clostridia bacterium]
MTEIAKAYGKTLYDLAVECESVEQMLDEITILRQAFEENPQFLTLMGTPNLKKEERVAIVDETFGGKIHIYLLNFLKVLVENGASHEFMDAAKQFRREYNWENGIETVTVVSAVALDAAQESELVKKLRELTGKKIQLEKTVDPSVMGGIRLQMDGLQMDGTVKNKLDAIRSRLLHTIA